ncbi:homeobox-containing protein 1-like protein [Leptotrombidium deliense]|uniref:Homeobox-containing protein 1-like protein n=1 Tax=Leptotrombidium deliense TaxID=299467 RepID=A0A443SMW4_9ACAR|nr:homeobox-containing protein 1-like protein [Leptotrombidium deliense]
MSNIRLTVEQTYLLQKLIRSGLSKEQLISAYDEVERFESQENGQRYEPLSSDESMHSQPIIASCNDWPSNELPASKANVSGVSPSQNREMPPSTSNEQMPVHKLGTFIKYEESPELDFFKSKGEAEILKEIRNFVSIHNISQITIADMIRISQGYVSRYLNGDIDHVSERVKNLIYLWYINCRSDPRILQQCLGSRVVLSPEGVLLPIRRDKFKFKKCHLNILERFFAETPYPNNNIKHLLAEACNFARKHELERELQAHEMVTGNLVNTWFQNRRKEMKESSVLSVSGDESRQ